jgi:hypothetical protein
MVPVVLSSSGTGLGENEIAGTEGVNTSKIFRGKLTLPKNRKVVKGELKTDGIILCK